MNEIPIAAVAWTGGNHIAKAAGLCSPESRILLRPLCSSTEGPADPVSQLMVAGVGYDTIEKWFTGASLTQCQQYQNGLWACELQRSGGNYDAWMLWSSTAASISVPVPGTFGLTVYRDWQNNVLTLPAQITVTQMPVLLENYDL
jgi:hypothetical protein